MATMYRKELNQLSAARVVHLTEPGLYADGGGLALQVAPGGSKSWSFRFMVKGKQRKMGLGSFPAVSLAQVREIAARYRTAIGQGLDPADVREKEWAARGLRAAPAEKTFDDCAASYIETHREGWKNPKHAQQWTNTLATYASPVFGLAPISSISTDMVLNVLRPIWTEKNETASRVRGRIENVLDWASAQKFRSGDNPARWRGHLEYLLADPTKVAPVKHHPALAFVRMASFFAELRRLNSISAAALEFCILTASRTNEVTGARVEEVNLKRGVWTIPKERMKMGREHRIPLTPRALQIAGQRIAIAKIDESIYLFPGKSKRTEARPISNMAMLEVVRGMSFGHITVHGFRSSFRDWAAECTEYPSDVVEMALAHVVKNKAEAAYRRGDMLERRQPLMAEWEKFCLQRLA